MTSAMWLSGIILSSPLPLLFDPRIPSPRGWLLTDAERIEGKLAIEVAVFSCWSLRKRRENSGQEAEKSGQFLLPQSKVFLGVPLSTEDQEQLLTSSTGACLDICDGIKALSLTNIGTAVP
ncbi:predicted protein [Histoplasma capsulatum var. duboisii H88]|uniref:Predicted protein n=2 Tax=Ajellomyces capsulatus TaxID=5037 RepID=F0UQH4_AJEC8|nr:predicted protein [Histoplasma capsulatum H143]EGC47964.1 predicted protein [Histoplasma capsulatum var. duboisii H88]